MKGKRIIECYDYVCELVGNDGLRFLMRKPTKKLEKYLRDNFNLSYYQSRETAFMIKN